MELVTIGLPAVVASCRDRYWSPEEWGALPPERQAFELAKMDQGDLVTQATLLGLADGRKAWTVIMEWTAQGLLGLARWP